MSIFLPQFRTNVSLFESAICLVPANLWNFLEARMLYGKCIKMNCGLIPIVGADPRGRVNILM